MRSELDQEKLLYERVWCLLDDRQLLRVFERFGASVFRRSSVLEGFERFLKAHSIQGSTCVEIGTLKGLTALVLARYFERVVSLDIAPDPQKHAIRAFLGVGNVRFIDVADNREKARIIESLEFDAAYVDGDHAHDTESDFALVRRCGRVLFHEHWGEQPAVVSLVGRLAGDVKKEGKFALWTA